MGNRRALLINPWIHDFAAYDLWCKPMALLTIARWLKNASADIYLLDCLDRYYPALVERKPENWRDSEKKNYFAGKFYKKLLEKPAQISHIKRPFYQYGLPENFFVDYLRSIPKPDICLISSMMTYWYTGTARSIEVFKSVYPDVPIVVGGIYPTMFPEHAESNINADLIHQGPPDNKLARFIEKKLGLDNKLGEYDPLAEPAYDLVYNKNSLSVMTSVGCPFSCSYCASNYLQPEYKRLPVDEIFNRLKFYNDKYGTTNFSFFDDALLFDAKNHIIPLLKKCISSNFPVSFHTPNGLHARFITPELAKLMYQSGFRTLRVSLETTDSKRQKQTGGKVYSHEIKKSISYLYEAGFKPENLAVYLLVGLPCQSKDEITQDIQVVHKMNARIELASFTPLPHTSVWNNLEKQSIVSKNEILLHNKAVFFLQDKTFTLDYMRELRLCVSKLNRVVN